MGTHRPQTNISRVESKQYFIRFESYFVIGLIIGDKNMKDDFGCFGSWLEGYVYAKGGTVVNISYNNYGKLSLAWE
jgi:hypothetical protein